MTISEARGASHRKVRWSAYRWHASQTLRQGVIASAAVAVTAGVLTLVFLSPLALRKLGALHGVSWSRLSDVGQTYGAASALLTGLALLGVVGSMVFQARANQISRAQAVREQHSHLIEMALADPVYQRAWGGLYDRYDGFDKYRQHGYLNLIVSFWQDHYVLGETRDDAMRRIFASLFRGEAGRTFWVDTRDMRMQGSLSSRDRRFYYLMEEEYQKATTEGPPAIAALAAPQEVSEHQPAASNHVVIREGMTLLLGVMGGIALESFMRHRRRYSTTAARSLGSTRLLTVKRQMRYLDAGQVRQA